MTDKIQALRTILALTPWKRDKVSRSVGEYLDGITDNIKGAPTLQGIIDKAIKVLKAP